MNAPACQPRRTWFPALIAILVAASAQASSLVPTTEAQDFKAAAGVCRGLVESVEAFRHPSKGGIFTRVRVRVLESIKGSFPKTITLVQRGGFLDGEGETTGLGVEFIPGAEYLLHLGPRADGTLAVLRGADGATRLTKTSKKLTRLRQFATTSSVTTTITEGQDFAEVAGVPITPTSTPPDASGLLTDGTYGVPARFIAPDRGEPIGYLVDTLTLPPGISQEAALQAIANACAAWTAATGVTFRFDGLENFGTSPASVTTNDGRIRIALHDSYGEITSSTTLGIGGRSYAIASGFTATGGDGGAVDGLEFRKTNRGYVVLKHTATSLQNPTTLEEVLCHEIGHVLGMAHSSEDPSESNPALTEAIMYYRAHKDGRGATLGAHDIPIIQKAHPPDDTPPFSEDRILTLVSAPTPLSGIPGVNEILLAANDLQSPSSSLTLVTDGPESDSLATGSFVGNLFRATQQGYYGDADVDPASTSYYYRKYIRFSDGSNLSPWTRIRITSIRSDKDGDGLPSSWSTTHFGNATSSASNLSRPGDDPDGDGFTNLDEFLLGTSPVDPSSRLAITAFDGETLQWPSTPYQLYTLESSTDLSTWTPLGLPVVPTSSTSTIDLPTPTAPRQFLRIRFGHTP